MTGVEVDPRSGFRSEQPIVPALNGLPKARFQSTDPLAGSSA